MCLLLLSQWEQGSLGHRRLWHNLIPQRRSARLPRPPSRAGSLRAASDKINEGTKVTYEKTLTLMVDLLSHTTAGELEDLANHVLCTV